MVDSLSYASLSRSVGEKGSKVAFTRCQGFKQARKTASLLLFAAPQQHHLASFFSPKTFSFVHFCHNIAMQRCSKGKEKSWLNEDSRRNVRTRRQSFCINCRGKTVPVPLILNFNELEIYSTTPSHNADKTLPTTLALSLRRPFFEFVICRSFIGPFLLLQAHCNALVGPCSTEKFDCKLKITSDQFKLDCCVLFQQSSYSNAAHHCGQLSRIRIASDQNSESNTNPSCILVLCKNTCSRKNARFAQFWLHCSVELVKCTEFLMT